MAYTTLLSFRLGTFSFVCQEKRIMFNLFVFITCVSQVLTMENGYEFGKMLPCESFLILSKFGLQQCFSECKAYTVCLSINYNRKQLVCGLNSVKKNESLLLVTEEDFVYNDLQVSNTVSRQCGDITCDPSSKCYRTSADRSACISSVCTDPVPEVENGKVTKRTYMPYSVIYECNPGFISDENKSVFHCVPGKGWGISKYSCFLACPGFSEQYEGRQYCFVTNPVVIWDNAKISCNQMNAHLVEIESQAKQDWIFSKVNSSFWIGLTDVGSEGVWYWEHSRNSPNFTAWGTYQPNAETDENCVLVETNAWHDYSCSTLSAFVCEK